MPLGEKNFFLREKMRWERIMAICVCAYLAVSLPLWLFSQEAARQCQPACEEAGCDIVLSAAVFEDRVECRCLDSITRQERIATTPKGG
jgi:hypothetical protein